MSNLYFDNAATTFPSQNSIREYVRILSQYGGNPSSSHSLGTKSKQLLEEVRCETASLLGLKKEDSKYIYFTSSATESNNIVLQSLLLSKSGGRVIISNSEHPSITENETILKKYGFEVVKAKSKNGIVSTKSIEELLTENTVLVECIFVNNILGSKNDILSIAKTVKQYSEKIGKKILFHTDAVQSIGKTFFTLNELSSAGCTSISFSAHKFYAPKGTGILFSTSPTVHSLSKAGGQERGVRGGTENIASICAMCSSLQEIQNNIKANIETVTELRNYLLKELSSTKIKYKVLSPMNTEDSVPNILSLSINGLPGEVCVRALSSNNIYVGTTSACASNAKKSEKNSLVNMGYSLSDATNAIRVSFSHYQTKNDIDALVKGLDETYTRYACA